MHKRKLRVVAEEDFEITFPAIFTRKTRGWNLTLILLMIAAAITAAVVLTEVSGFTNKMLGV